jgi:hypothetical protein
VDRLAAGDLDVIFIPTTPNRSVKPTVVARGFFLSVEIEIVLDPGCAPVFLMKVSSQPRERLVVVELKRRGVRVCSS